MEERAETAAAVRTGRFPGSGRPEPGEGAGFGQGVADRAGYWPTLAFHSASQASRLSSATAAGISFRFFAVSSP